MLTRGSEAMLLALCWIDKKLLCGKTIVMKLSPVSFMIYTYYRVEMIEHSQIPMLYFPFIC